jgi:molybdopterin/thiamine biosynthesis adenylyltransferase/rhodanese-related sulfurtransferase
MQPVIPLTANSAAPTADARERAARTTALPGIGPDGQQRLAAARVLVIGAGGIGSPLLQYLAATGVGVIGVVDFDTVDLSNLQRQVIHGSSDVGELKTTSAARSMARLDPAVRVIEHAVRLHADNALELFSDYDIIADGSDNFETRYLANDAAALLGKPYVWGSVLRFDGQVTVFWQGAPDGRSVDYRDLHPVPPAPGEVLSCAEAGVLGSVCGTIGTMMATEVIKLITGIGEPLLGRVQLLDALAGEWREVALRRHPARIPVAELIDYEAFCGVPAAVETSELGAGRLIDVREQYEHDAGHLEGDELIPLARLLADPSLAGPGPVVVYCATGARSARAVAALEAAGIPATSLRGGFAAWSHRAGSSTV